MIKNNHNKINKEMLQQSQTSLPARLSAYSLSFLLVIQPLLVSAQNIVVQGTNTQVETTANGIDQINIATPSAKGVSHNRFQHYNVDEKGLILNNAKAISSTQLSGYINANPHLQNSNAAKVIINEVVAPNRSELKGFTEVGGQAAAVVVANPYGISCNGCGFINTPRATLTTGTPVISNGELTGLTVNGGDIRIEGDGLNAGETSQFDLVTRAVKLNAKLHAKELNLVLGNNQVDYASLNASKLAAKDNNIKFALDSSALGGMYANAIKLVGTEAGVGVRNMATMAADASELTLSIEGKLENSGTINSRTNTTITAEKINNSGILYATGNSRLTASSDIENTQTIAAHGDVTLQANNINSSTGSIIVAGLNSDSTLDTTAASNLNLTAGKTISAQGKNIAVNTQTLTAQTVNLSNSQTAAKDITLHARTNDIDLTKATISANNTLSLTAKQTLTTDSAAIAANQLNITAHDLSNQEGEMIQTGAGKMNMTLSGELDNTQGRIATNADNLTITADTVTNASGQLQHAGRGTFDLNTTSITTNNGTIQSNGTLELSATTAILDGGNTVAERLTIDTTTLSNQSGNILQSGTGTAQITATTQLNNTGGTIASNGDMTITAGVLNNQSGTIQSAGTASLTISATESIGNTTGQISAAQNLTLTTPTLSGNGTLLSGQDTNISLQSDYTQTASNQIRANRNLNLTTTGKLTNTGDLQAVHNLNLKAAEINNQGTLAAGETLTAATATLSNNGRIVGDAVTLRATSKLENVGSDALIGATGTTSILALLSPVIENRDDSTTTDTTATTTIYGVGKVILAGGQDHSGQYTSASQILNQSALIESGGDMQIFADTLTNTRRQLKTSSTYIATGETDSGEVIWTPENPDVLGGRYIEPPHGGEWNSDYLYTSYTGIKSRNRITEISPRGLIEVGGDLTPTVTTFNNYWSSVAAGGNISLTGVTLDQDGWNNGNGGTAYTPYSESLVYSGSYWYRTYRGVIWKHDWGPDSPVITPIAGYDSNFTSAGTISGTAASIDNGAANSGGTPLGMPSIPAPATAGSTTNPDLTLPNNNLFQIRTESTANYLIETDERFTRYQRWISSDEMLIRLNLDPDTTQKRLGDGFYEQRLIRTQLEKLTGRRLLAGYTDSQSQYQALIAAGVNAARSMTLSVGIELTAEQIASLNQDMIWLINKTVTLTDGTTTQVLAPQVYLSQHNHALRPTGNLIAAHDIRLDDINTFINGGTLLADNSLTINADDINNRGGKLQSGGLMQLGSRYDIELTSAELKAGSLKLDAGRNLVLNTDSQQHNSAIQGGTRRYTRLGRIASIEVTNDAEITTGNDFEQQGGTLQVGGNLKADIGNDWKLGTVKQQQTTKVTRLNGHSDTDITTHLTSRVEVGGTTDINVNRDLTAKAASFELTGNANITAGRDLTLTAVKNSIQVDSSSASSRHTESMQSNKQTVIGTTMHSENNISLQAANDLTLQASRIKAEKDIALAAQGDTVITGVEQQHYSHQYHKNKKSFGRSKAATIEKERYRNIESSLNAGGNLTINSTITDNEIIPTQQAGNVTIIGSELKAEQDIALYAGDTLTTAPGVDYDYEHIEIQKKGWFGTGSQYSRTSQQQRQQQAQIGSGQNTDLKAGNNLTLIAPKITSKGDVSLSAETGTVTLATAKDIDYVNEQYSKTGAFSWKTRTEGHQHETVRQTEITANGDININAGNGIIVQYKQNGTLEQSIDSLSQLPEYNWLKQLKQRKDTNWQAVAEIHDEWLKQDSGIGGPGFTMVAIAVSIATSGAGTKLLGFKGTLTAAQAAQAAVLDSLINQAAMSVIANQGDIGAVFKDLASKQGLMNLATAGATAGMTNSLYETLDIPQGVSIADLDTTQLLQSTLINATTKATLDAALQGKSLGDSLVNNLRLTAVNALGAKLTNEIGQAWHSGDPTQMNKALQLIAHAATGCVVSVGNEGKCAGGAAGAVTGEIVGSLVAKDIQEKLASQTVTVDDLQRWQQQGIDLAKLTGGVAALIVSSGDSKTTNAGAQAGASAAQNNALLMEWLLDIDPVKLRFATLCKRTPDNCNYSTYRRLRAEDNVQNVRIIYLTKEKISQDVLDAIEGIEKLPEAIDYLMEHPEVLEQLPAAAKEAFGKAIDALEENFVNAARGNIESTPEWYEKQAQAEAAILATLTETLVGALVGKEIGVVAIKGTQLTIQTAKVVVQKTRQTVKFSTDDLGRINKVEGKLDLDIKDRNSHQQNSQLITSMLNGPGGKTKLLSGNLNEDEWRKLEKEWMSALKEGKSVKVSVEPVYSGNSTRPESFKINYFIDDRLTQKVFQNTAPKGGTITQTTTGGTITQVTKGTGKTPNEAFHYTDAKWKESINTDGLRTGSYATPDGTLSPMQASIELSLPPNRNLPNAKLRIDLDAMRRDGYKIPEPTRVSNVVKGSDGRVYTRPGGGYEMQFDYEIPPKYISIVE